MFGFIFSWLTGSKVGRMFGMIAAGALAVLGIFAAGKRDERKAQKVRELKENIATRKRIDEAPTTNDADIARKRLHERKSKRNL